MSDTIEQHHPELTQFSKEGRLPVMELFGPTIQGEGALAGQVSFFLRLGGCGYRCTWCDSMHAVDPKRIKEGARWMTPGEVVGELRSLRATNGTRPRRWITLTGGDPVIWDCDQLVDMLLTSRTLVAVETQGEYWRDWLEKCDMVTVSPKPPSSGMANKMSISLLQKYKARLSGQLVAKVVIFNDDDLEFAARIRKILPDIPFYLSAGTPHEGVSLDNNEELRMEICDSYRSLCEKVCAIPSFHDMIVLPQLHALAWGRALGR